MLNSGHFHQEVVQVQCSRIFHLPRESGKLDFHATSLTSKNYFQTLYMGQIKCLWPGAALDSLLPPRPPSLHASLPPSLSSILPNVVIIPENQDFSPWSGSSWWMSAHHRCKAELTNFPDLSGLEK